MIEIRGRLAGSRPRLPVRARRAILTGLRALARLKRSRRWSGLRPSGLALALALPPLALALLTLPPLPPLPPLTLLTLLIRRIRNSVGA